MKREAHLDPVLGAIEFPGEEESIIRTWLETRDFADAVVRESRRLRVVSLQSVLWGSSLISVLGAGILAAGSSVLEAAGGGIVTFACLLFGALVAATLVGFFATLHPSWYRNCGPEPGQRPAATPQTRP